MLRTRSLAVFACMDKSCAPPPVGTGGSRSVSKKGKGGGKSAPVSAGEKSSVGGSVQPTALSRPEQIQLLRQMSVATGQLEKSNKNFAAASKAYMNYGFGAINALLRSGKKEATDWLDPTASKSEQADGIFATFAQVKKATADFKAFHEQAPALPVSVTLFRGLNVPVSMKVGDTFTDRGFVSTSLSRSVVDDFLVDVQGGGMKSLGSAHTVLRIAAPKGTKALYGREDEEEFILGPDTKFRVTQTGQEGAATVIDVEIVE